MTGHGAPSRPPCLSVPRHPVLSDSCSGPACEGKALPGRACPVSVPESWQSPGEDAWETRESLTHRALLLSHASSSTPSPAGKL